MKRDVKLKYGIISASSIAPRFIAAVREAGAGEIYAISSRTQEKANQKAAEWNIPIAYGSYTELLCDENVNVVYISSVNSEHYSMAKAALEKGKHVVCEKPCTISSVQTKELFDIAEKRGLFLMEAQKMLFLPVIKQVLEAARAGEIGEIKLIEFNHSFSAGYNNWLFEPSLGGGTLLSSGIYAIQFLLYLCGGIREVGGSFTCEEGLAENGYTLCGKTESGVLFTIKNSTSVVLDNCAKIFGTDGSIVIPDFWKARRAVIHINGRDDKTVCCPVEHELVYEAEHIKDCLAGGVTESPVVTREISVGAIEVIERIKALWSAIA